MFPLLLAVGGVGAVLVTSEVLWRLDLLRGEKARKFVHILVGCYVAFWPFFLSWGWIQLISLGFLVGVSLSYRHGIFQAVHGVPRRTIGEFLYAAAIGMCALIQPSPAIFAVAILHLSLADGMAALVGGKFDKRHKYKIFGHYKTLAGTATFYAVSFSLLAIYFGSQGLLGWSLAIPVLLIWLPIVLTMAENVAVAGVDNILIPLLVLTALLKL